MNFLTTSFFADEKPSNMELRAKCITTMQATEYAVEHSVSLTSEQSKLYKMPC
jgi:hypothetical protein